MVSFFCTRCIQVIPLLTLQNCLSQKQALVILERTYTAYCILKPRLHDNRLNVCIHDTTGCQTGSQTCLTTGLTTGWMFVYTIQPVVKPVVQPVVSCKRGIRIEVGYALYTYDKNSVRSVHCEIQSVLEYFAGQIVTSAYQITKFALPRCKFF